MTRPATVVWAGPEEGAVVEVSATGDAARAVGDHVPRLVAEKVASRLAAQDPTLWGEAAEAEAAVRLGWTDLHATSRPLLAPLRALREELAAEGVDRVVLCGMGGSSLAPEVVAGTAGAQLTVLDSTDPDQVRRALDGDLRATVVVVSSKSGSTLETDSHRRIFEAAFADAGIDAASRIVVVTDPGSPLHEAATAAGYRAVLEADPHVGGRFSALSAFGLVASALAGADVEQLLDEAAEVAEVYAEDSEANPALVLAAALAGTEPLRDKIVLRDAGSGLFHLGDWVEQLVAESTGKDGTGLLPVVVGSRAPELDGAAPDVLPVVLLPLTDDAAPASDGPGDAAPGSDGFGDAAEADGRAGDGNDDDDAARTEVTVAGSLGAVLLLWENAVAIAGRLLGVNPFDQPDVEAAKSAARGLLESTPPPERPAFEDSGVEVRASAELLGGADTVAGAVEALLATLGERGYLAVMAYLDREGRAADLLGDVRADLAARTGRPVTFGWGPRFLHSTGQLHKGGPAVGAFLQITGEAEHQVLVPGRDFDLAALLAAQAAGDAAVLAGLGRPVLRLHVTTPDALAWLAGVLAGPVNP
ncbi:glucose-6-phosphate isomerase [Georgenia muralis]|uniref:Glucose-6-phosphate isomerase n=1 Tax=Georgenia muralis TaxID=154117 RepID=A0A3N4ZRU0_9MICO|nr:glucose-6-phosphate isomerase [Georgenia muralis]RPF28192.1 glucose-6-phosphate isomerase [Georgenia muralis]